MSKAKVFSIAFAWIVAAIAFVATAAMETYALFVPGNLHSALYGAGPAQIANGDGGWRLATAVEVKNEMGRTAMNSVVPAIIACGVMLIINRLVMRRLGSTITKLAIGLPLCALFGGVLSFIVYAIVGGWGPPFFLPAVAAGLVLGVASFNSGEPLNCSLPF